MCGRYGLVASAKVLGQSLGVPTPPETPPLFQTAPSQWLPVLTAESPKLLRLLRWGLVPQWAKDTTMASINARSETIQEKPSFKGAFKYRRCLIPASGYFEWKKTPAGKQPYWIFSTEEDVFTMAGIWEAWSDAFTGEMLQTFSIITVPANNRLAELHERMPAIIRPQMRSTYLDHRLPLMQVQSMLQPLADERTNAYPVSLLANKAANNLSDIIEPVGPLLA